jgi:hypothetical protein
VIFVLDLVNKKQRMEADNYENTTNTLPMEGVYVGFI